MTIEDASFDNEAELERWAFNNAQIFFGPSLILPGFRITTPSGKHAVPDGLTFNFSQRAWWIVECELLAHGVWPHIAEQVTRFVVAAHNANTLRQIRDKLFDSILESRQQGSIAAALGTDLHH
jgi:hypothetical protein